MAKLEIIAGGEITQRVMEDGTFQGSKFVFLDSLYEQIDLLIEECEHSINNGLPERKWGAVYLKRLKEQLREGK